MRDQPAFNLITHEGVGGHSLVPAVRVPCTRGAPTGIAWCTTAKRDHFLGVLPNWLGNGHTYFVQWHTSRDRKTASRTACT